MSRRLPDVAILVLLALQLPVALVVALDGGLLPGIVVALLWVSLPVDALLGVVYGVNLVKAFRRGARELRLQAVGLLLCVLDVLAIAWVFRDATW